MSIIEQAARRLEELRRSGIGVPALDISRVNKDVALGAAEGVPARLVRMLNERQLPPGEGLRDPNRPSLRGVAPPPRSTPARESRHFDIDLARLAGMGYLTPETPRAQIADEFRVIKRPLLVNLRGKSAPV